MADFSKDELKKRIKEIVGNADLSSLTSRTVRTKLEETLDTDLSSRRKEIDELVMAEIDENQSPSEEEEQSEEEYEAPPKKGGKKAAAAPPPKGSDSGEDSDEDFKPAAKKGGGKKKAAPKKRKGSDDDSDDGDWRAKKKMQTESGSRRKSPPKKAAPKAGGGAKKGSAFTKSFKLSEELADVVGSDVMPRHEVVKKLWAVIKERELQDPKNKQFAICDDQLLKVFGVKRFRTFGMMKHLKDHFLEAA